MKFPVDAATHAEHCKAASAGPLVPDSIDGEASSATNSPFSFELSLRRTIHWTAPKAARISASVSAAISALISAPISAPISALISATTAANSSKRTCSFTYVESTLRNGIRKNTISQLANSG